MSEHKMFRYQFAKLKFDGKKEQKYILFNITFLIIVKWQGNDNDKLLTTSTYSPSTVKYGTPLVAAVYQSSFDDSVESAARTEPTYFGGICSILSFASASLFVSLLSLLQLYTFFLV